MNPYIFREYDIRGIVKTDLKDHDIYLIGRAFATYINKMGAQKIAISGDVRESTPAIKENFSNGMLDSGINVIDMGIVPTPANYYSMYKLQIDGAVQITGSHNPPEFNGIKLSFNKKPFYGQDIQNLLKIIKEQRFTNGKGILKKENILDNYHLMLKNKINIYRPLKIVMDCANASACLSAPKLFVETGIEVKELFCEVDNSFPNHHPDPTEDHNLRFIIDEITKGNFDFGVAFDGDADRIVAIDECGNIIRSDILMALFLPEIIKNNDNIVFDVKCSKALIDMINHYNGNPVMWKTGHSLIKDKMKELNSPFGGEMSGHIFFSDNYFGYDDAIYVALRLAELISKSDKTLSELTKEIPKYYSTPEIRIECKNDKEKFEISKKINSYFKKHYDCIDIDGVRINFKEGWGLVRASNTQPVIVCRFEATSVEHMNEIKTLVLNMLNKYGDL